MSANILAALAAPSDAMPGVYNIACSKPVSINAVYKKIATLLGTDIKPIYGPERKGDVRHSDADISRAKEFLGYEPQVDFEKGLELSMEWYKRIYNNSQAVQKFRDPLFRNVCPRRRGVRRRRILPIRRNDECRRQPGYPYEVWVGRTFQQTDRRKGLGVKKLLSYRRAASLVRGFNKARVLVAGDLIVDHFIWGKVTRISPEAPVPVVQVTKETVLLGGSANVVNNLRSLGAKVYATGVIGNDRDGRKLKSMLARKGIPRAE